MLYSVDELIKTRSVSELRDLVSSMEKDSISKQAELQHLVGSKYHDFIQSADTIALMHQKTEEIEKRFATFSNFSKNLIEASTELLNRTTASSEIEIAQSQFEPLDITCESIWSHLENNDVYNSALILYIANDCLTFSYEFDTRSFRLPLTTYYLPKALLTSLPHLVSTDLGWRSWSVTLMRETIEMDLSLTALQPSLNISALLPVLPPPPSPTHSEALHSRSLSSHPTPPPLPRPLESLVSFPEFPYLPPLQKARALASLSFSLPPPLTLPQSQSQHPSPSPLPSPLALLQRYLEDADSLFEVAAQPLLTLLSSSNASPSSSSPSPSNSRSKSLKKKEQQKKKGAPLPHSQHSGRMDKRERDRERSRNQLIGDCIVSSVGLLQATVLDVYFFFFKDYSSTSSSSSSSTTATTTTASSVLFSSSPFSSLLPPPSSSSLIPSIPLLSDLLSHSPSHLLPRGLVPLFQTQFLLDAQSQLLLSVRSQLDWAQDSPQVDIEKQTELLEGPMSANAALSLVNDLLSSLQVPSTQLTTSTRLSSRISSSHPPSSSLFSLSSHLQSLREAFPLTPMRLLFDDWLSRSVRTLHSRMRLALKGLGSALDVAKLQQRVWSCSTSLPSPPHNTLHVSSISRETQARESLLNYHYTLEDWSEASLFLLSSPTPTLSTATLPPLRTGLPSMVVSIPPTPHSLAESSAPMSHQSSPRYLLWSRVFRGPFLAQVERLLRLSCLDILTLAKSRLSKALSSSTGGIVRLDPETLQISLKTPTSSSSFSPLPSVEISRLAEQLREDLEGQLRSLSADIIQPVREADSASSTASPTSQALTLSLTVHSARLLGHLSICFRTLCSSLSALLSPLSKAPPTSSIPASSSPPSHPHLQPLLQSLLLIGRLAWNLKQRAHCLLFTSLSTPAALSSLKHVPSTSPSLSPSLSSTLDQLRSAFEIADTEGRGVLSLKEAEEALQALDAGLGSGTGSGFSTEDWSVSSPSSYMSRGSSHSPRSPHHSSHSSVLDPHLTPSLSFSEFVLVCSHILSPPPPSSSSTPFSSLSSSSSSFSSPSPTPASPSPVLAFSHLLEVRWKDCLDQLALEAHHQWVRHCASCLLLNLLSPPLLPSTSDSSQSSLSFGDRLKEELGLTLPSSLPPSPSSSSQSSSSFSSVTPSPLLLYSLYRYSFLRSQWGEREMEVIGEEDTESTLDEDETMLKDQSDQRPRKKETVLIPLRPSQSLLSLLISLQSIHSYFFSSLDCAEPQAPLSCSLLHFPLPLSLPAPRLLPTITSKKQETKRGEGGKKSEKEKKKKGKDPSQDDWEWGEEEDLGLSESDDDDDESEIDEDGEMLEEGGEGAEAFLVSRVTHLSSQVLSSLLLSTLSSLVPHYSESLSRIQNQQREMGDTLLNLSRPPSTFQSSHSSSSSSSSLPSFDRDAVFCPPLPLSSSPSFSLVSASASWEEDLCLQLLSDLSLSRLLAKSSETSSQPSLLIDTNPSLLSPATLLEFSTSSFSHCSVPLPGPLSNRSLPASLALSSSVTSHSSVSFISSHLSSQLLTLFSLVRSSIDPINAELLVPLILEETFSFTSKSKLLLPVLSPLTPLHKSPSLTQSSSASTTPFSSTRSSYLTSNQHQQQVLIHSLFSNPLSCSRSLLQPLPLPSLSLSTPSPSVPSSSSTQPKSVTSKASSLPANPPSSLSTKSISLIDTLSSMGGMGMGMTSLSLQSFAGFTNKQ